MIHKNQNFLEAVLGQTGTIALLKASQHSEEIHNALMPRSVLAWIKAKQDFEGNIPGTDGFVSFKKSENGFSGEVAIGEELHKFVDASLFHVAASVAVAIDAEYEAVSGLRDLDLERLGKSIDLLASREHIVGLLVKSDEGMAIANAKDAEDELSDEEYEKKYGKKRLEKAGAGPGKPAGAIAPTAPTAPTATAPPPKTQPMKPAKVPGAFPAVKPATTPAPTMKLKMSEANFACKLCGETQMKGPKFKGCFCFAGLAKSARVIAADEEGFTIQLSNDWDSESIATLLEAVGHE
jgi:hypothetical protein